MHKILFSLFIVLLVLGCSSGKKQLERGDYYEAVIKSVNRLKNNPDHKKSKETLRHAYPLAVESLTEKAEFGISSNSNEKWINAVDQYKKLYTLYNLIKETPGARYVIPDAKSYFTVLSEAKNNAAEESYTDGVKYLNKNNTLNIS